MASLADGDAGDRDGGLSAVFTLGFDDLIPAYRDEAARQAASASPSTAASGDLIFVIDPIGMILFTTTVQ